LKKNNSSRGFLRKEGGSLLSGERTFLWLAGKKGFTYGPERQLKLWHLNGDLPCDCTRKREHLSRRRAAKKKGAYGSYYREKNISAQAITVLNVFQSPAERRGGFEDRKQRAHARASPTWVCAKSGFPLNEKEKFVLVHSVLQRGKGGRTYPWRAEKKFAPATCVP